MDSLVSVIIPTMNRLVQTQKAVESILKQTYQNIEIIVVDDSKEDCSKYFNQPKVTYIWNHNPKGSPAARNIGIEKAKGDYIAFLDDDDEWLPTKIEKQLTMFDGNTMLVGCWINDYRFDTPYILRAKEKVYLGELLNMFNFLSTSAYVFDRRFLDSQKFDINFPSAQEYELAIRACISFPIKCYQEVLVIQNKSENQITKNWKKKKQGLKLLLKKHQRIYMSYNLWYYIKIRFKFLGIQCLYSLAYVFGDRIYKIIVPLKKYKY